MTGQQGFSGVARDVLAGAAAELAEDPAPEQLDLVALLPPRRYVEGSQAQKVADFVRDGQRARGAGRPPGAQNLATREVKEYVRRVFGDPLLESARWLLHSPAGMAIELGCKVVEAFELQEAIRRDLRRYFYAPMTPVDDQGRPVPLLNLIFGAGVPGAARADQPPWLADPEVVRTIEHSEQNQGLNDNAADKSQGESRTDEASS